MPSGAPRNSYCSSVAPQPTAQAALDRVTGPPTTRRGKRPSPFRGSNGHATSAPQLRQRHTSMRRANTTTTPPPSRNPFSRLIAAGDLPRSNNPFSRHEASGGLCREASKDIDPEGSGSLRRCDALAPRKGPSRTHPTREASSKSIVRDALLSQGKIGMTRSEFGAQRSRSGESNHLSGALIPMQRSNTVSNHPSPYPESNNHLTATHSDASPSSPSRGPSIPPPAHNTVIYNVTNINIGSNNNGGGNLARDPLSGISRVEITEMDHTHSTAHRHGGGLSRPPTARLFSLDDDDDDGHSLKARRAHADAWLSRAKNQLRAAEIEYSSPRGREGEI